ncbi:hypothetical protein Tco_0052187 [Tanacetum coccineum]
MEELQCRMFRGDRIKGKGHMARQYIKLKRPKNSEWFKEKMLLAHALESWVVLDEEQMAFLVNAFDSDCDEAPSTSAVLIAKLFAYDSDILSENQWLTNNKRINNSGKTCLMQVKIGLNNFRIALEKTQPDVIYKVCLAILQQYSFFNAFIRTIDAPRSTCNRKATSYDRLRACFKYFGEWSHVRMLSLLSSSGKTSGSRLIPKNPIDQTLGNLKFANKGAVDPILGMPIPTVMLSDEIKASEDYQNYLAKSLGTQPTKGVEDDIYFEETEEVDQIPLVQRQTGVVIGRQVHQESDEEALDHSKKLKGVERMSKTAESLL